MYFNTFPQIPYDNYGNGDFRFVTNLLRRVALRINISQNTSFFDTYDVDRIITSVGLYLGEGSFLNSSTKDGVSESDINDPYYWKEKFFFGTRIFK